MGGPPAGGPGRGPMGRPVPDERATEKDQALALRRVRIFSVVLLGALWLGVFSPPWPLPLLAGVLGIVALVIGVQALVTSLRARVRGAVVALLIGGLLLALLTTLATAGQALYWQEFSAYEECRSNALTVQAQNACDARLEQDLNEHLPGMEELPLPTGN